jgi:glycosyltransferase involved in cell wall biosynthesis
MLKKLVNELDVSKNIFFLGEKKRNQVYSYMKSSKIFVLPSLWEGFAIVVVEAMACGLPVVAISGKINAAVEIIGEEGIVVENDPAKLANIIKKMLSSESIIKKIPVQSIKNPENFNWDTIAKKTEFSYKSLSKIN